MEATIRLNPHTAGALLAVTGGTLAILPAALPTAGIVAGPLESPAVTFVAGVSMLAGGVLLFVSR